MTPAIDLARLMAELHALATFTEAGDVSVASTDETAVSRVVFTDTDLRARAYVSELARAAGLSERRDAVGNTFFRWQGSGDGAIATGSHIDAIPNAGMYDGTVGVLGAIEAVRALQASGFAPRRSIDVILFTSEEPTRFGIGCLGSRLLSGTLTPEAAAALTDKEGSGLELIRTRAGFAGLLTSVPLMTGAYEAFVELHIEQGPLLEREHESIGIVTAIAAPASLRLTIEGEGGHAGALLMPLRRDALVAAAEIIQAVEKAALATGAIDTVATVGICDVFPGAVNSVPSRVMLTLDVRDIEPERRDGVLTAISTAWAEIGKRRQVRVTEEWLNRDQPSASSALVVEAIAKACAEQGIQGRRMVSRAYHDSLFMARVAPMAMIFIPCRGGVSHRPDEFAAPEDIGCGVAVLAGTLQRLSA